jgi:hypothetical protein
MGKNNLGVDGALGQIILYQIITEFTNTGAGIDDNQPIDIFKSQFKAGGVSSIFHGLWTRAGKRPSNPPKS